ncbi:hypothetical protein LTR97_007000 [Elasticomyces elasticus]|uniref:Uncharacterized protein n=1 Tax=Elasticomyces elasticus TaxID=574655 RepID=A0AAN7W921_9PEZI|nr:hypothetical protein LTR97_007000 [Elasticomyces elasticus]
MATAQTGPVNVGCGFKVHTNYKTSGGTYFYEGDEGRITKPGVEKGWVHVNILRRGASAPNKGVPVEAWVPRSIVNCGLVPYGQITLDPRLPTVSTKVPPKPPAVHPSNVFESTVVELLVAIKANIDDDVIDGVANEWETLLDNDHLSTTYSTIIQGVKKAGVYQTLRKADFTGPELRDVGKRIHKLGHKDAWSGIGVYEIAVADFKEDNKREMETYIGKSGDMSARCTGHNSSLNKDTDLQEVHKSINQAYNWKMFALCLLDDESEKIKTLVEQLFVMLLRTYHAKLLTWDVDTSAKSVPRVMDSVSRRFWHKQDAAVFIRIANEVFKKTGWARGCGTTGFGSSVGLNVSSPLTEPSGLYEKLLWIRTEVPGVVATYTRRPILVLLDKGGNSTSITPFSGVQIILPKDGPPAGIKVEFTIEVMLDGNPHRFQYARIPFVGPYEDWLFACSFGIRITWDNAAGSESKLYLQQSSVRRHALNFVSKDIGSLSHYSRAIHIMRYLHQQKLQAPIDWQKDDAVSGRIARVRRITFDVLTQVIEIAPADVTHERYIERPKTLSKATITAQLSAHGAKQIDSTTPQFDSTDTVPQEEWRTVPGSYATAKTITNVPRKQCDACHRYTQVTYDPYAETSPIVCGNGVCELCPKLGRPCSFTKTTDLQGNEKLKRAVGPPATWVVETPSG